MKLSHQRVDRLRPHEEVAIILGVDDSIQVEGERGVRRMFPSGVVTSEAELSGMILPAGQSLVAGSLRLSCKRGNPQAHHWEAAARHIRLLRVRKTCQLWMRSLLTAMRNSDR